MTRAIPQVGRYMSICPFTIEQEQRLIEAHLLMREHQIRHLPVLHGGKLAGMISERDVRLRELQSGMDPEETRVREVMTTDVYAVPPDTPLDEVVQEMAAHKYGSTVIVHDGKVIGVFTSIDAMVAFAAVLAARAAS